MGKIRNNIKMRVNPEQSRKVQEICFENGIEWFSGRSIEHLDEPFLFIDKYISFMNEAEGEHFLKRENEEVSAELFIMTNGTCVESETLTENNNKGEQMEELKLECLVEGYEGTYFEVGQVWETRDGRKIILKDFIKDEKYPLVFDIGNTYPEEFTLKGTYFEDAKHKLDLVRLISTEDTTESTPSEEPQPKTLSKYLKENNAYESFVENSIEYFLEKEDTYKKFKENRTFIDISNVFIWEDTKPSLEYWVNLSMNKPKNLRYDMNEIIFAEVDKRIAEQDSKPESEPKTLSEYLKENNAYEAFIENCVARALLNTKDYECKRGKAEDIDDYFIWANTKEGLTYWEILQSNTPKPIEYDMNEIIFAEVDKRIAEQKAPTEFISTEEFNQMFEQNSSTKYMVFVEGRSNPKKVHDSYDSAEKEAKRLSAKEIGCNVFVISVVKTFKSKVIVEEV